MLPEWTVVLKSCLRQIRLWHVPPNWSARDWWEEMSACGSVATLQAVCDFDPSRGVPWSAFLRHRVIASAFTHYRREWRYAIRCVSQADANEHWSMTSVAFAK